MRIDRAALAAELAKRDANYARLAEITGVSKNTIYAIKGGKTCDVTTAQKIADALGVELETISEAAVF